MQLGCLTLSPPAAHKRGPQHCTQEQVTDLNATELPFTNRLVPNPFATTIAAYSQNPASYIFGRRRLQSAGPLS